MRTFKLTVAYDGTDFAGWQVQPGRPTIQGALQSALSAVTRATVPVIGSGRTDAGVHAIAQVASCVVPRWRATDAELARALNTKLPNTVSVVDVADAPDGFHALRDAVGKRYRYQIRVGGPRDPFDYRYSWQLPGPLDCDAMCDAASRLVGRHDFASFQAAGADRKSTVRHVSACELLENGEEAEHRCNDRLPHRGSFPAMSLSADGTGERRLAIEVEANGFLYNMVRNIVGTLVEIGRGRREPGWIEQVLEAKDRDAAGPTAPAHGLFLQRVDYSS